VHDKSGLPARNRKSDADGGEAQRPPDERVCQQNKGPTKTADCHALSKRPGAREQEGANDLSRSCFRATVVAWRCVSSHSCYARLLAIDKCLDTGSRARWNRRQATRTSHATNGTSERKATTSPTVPNDGAGGTSMRAPATKPT